MIDCDSLLSFVLSVSHWVKKKLYSVSTGESTFNALTVIVKYTQRETSIFEDLAKKWIEIAVLLNLILVC